MDKRIDKFEEVFATKFRAFAGGLLVSFLPALFLGVALSQAGRGKVFEYVTERHGKLVKVIDPSLRDQYRELRKQQTPVIEGFGPVGHYNQPEE